jgi:2'-5' RNA ligase
LLFALFPGDAEASGFRQTAWDLRDTHHLGGQPLKQRRLHMTLIKVKSYGPDGKIPQDDIDAAVMAASRVSYRSFPIIFNRAVSYPQSHAFVLECDELSNKRIAILRQMLAQHLKAADLPREQTTTPHMTMLYDRHRHFEPHAVPPMAWAATRFALILSHVGLTHHQWIKEWRL